MIVVNNHFAERKYYAQNMSILRSEEGSTLVIAFLMIALLTVIGIAATTTSEIGVRIAHNERVYQRDFYVSDSGWKEAALWLDLLGGPPARVNSDPADQTVKNFGNWPSDSGYTTFPEGTEDNILAGVPYWYQVVYVGNSIVPGSGKNHRKYKYRAASNANRSQQINVGLSKIYKAGY